ncbi:hypothetical protein L1987_17360 [Smallanthus sonchifolius]|uniref:Uncharacterized protein n=1 Tax=Smallanthus sonchifolius TaxID=185202 RepID=A0ACB9IWP5_9ASTR|nr:hypothetical protein L1987_17360 [Smallanthus sonchifolius]
MPLITNEWQVLFLVWILFQWGLDEWIYLHVLLLLLYPELLHVLLDVKHTVDFRTIHLLNFSSSLEEKRFWNQTSDLWVEWEENGF